jgi:hypothetical protein
MKVKLHFNRINMSRKLPQVWSAHTHVCCNGSKEVFIRHGGKIIGKTVFNPEGRQPRAYIEFFGEVNYENEKAIIDV